MRSEPPQPQQGTLVSCQCTHIEIFNSRDWGGKTEREQNIEAEKLTACKEGRQAEQTCKNQNASAVMMVDFVC